MTNRSATPRSGAADRGTGASPRQARRSRDDVVETAMRLLADGGLPALSMRNIAGALDVQASALYWHFPNKQSILAAVSDAILADVDRGDGEHASMSARELAVALRDALADTTDGAEIVASTLALGLGERHPADLVARALDRDARRDHPDPGGRRASAPGASAPNATDGTATLARTVTHYVLGHTQHWQQRRFAEGIGLCEPSPVDERAEFIEGLALLLPGA